MINLIGELIQDWRRLDDRIASVSTEIEAIAKRDESCQRLMHSGRRLDRLQRSRGGDRQRQWLQQGRDFAAWLRLMPNQVSTGDRTILGMWAVPHCIL
jgi:transposase